VKALGIVLIVVTGLLTFHPPHFLLEPGRSPGTGAGAVVLEIALAVDLLVALLAALGVWRGARWGWLLGIVIAVIAVALYLVQQTIGLPGLPKNWVEPSRLVSLAVQALFIALAIRQLRRRHGTPHTGLLRSNRRQARE
jgi:hypothetical protein